MSASPDLNQLRPAQGSTSLRADEANTLYQDYYHEHFNVRDRVRYPTGENDPPRRSHETLPNRVGTVCRT